jgi:hypothetical protein
MADWDENSPVLQANILSVIRHIRTDAHRRSTLTIEDARRWHIAVMKGLTPPNPAYVGTFRGEPGVENIGVKIGEYKGTPSHDVAADLAKFNETLQKLVEALDDQLPKGKARNAQNISDILDLCAWVHSEWVRIHPFVNGNGRTARLWVNAIALRYGLPAFLQVRPRPKDDYENAATLPMQNDWKSTLPLFRKLLDKAVSVC